MLKREAIYTFLTSAAEAMASSIKFEDWYSSMLSAEVCNQDPNFTPLVRQILLLSAKWCAVAKLPRELPMSHTRAIAHQDPVVILTAVQSLRDILEIWELEVQPFEPIMKDMLGVQIEAAKSLQSSSSRILILRCCTSIVQAFTKKQTIDLSLMLDAVKSFCQCSSWVY